MILSIASGKGGTGKTTVATNLALTLSGSARVQLVDADVEEPNAHIFLKPAFMETEQVTVPVPEIDEDRCTRCGKCAKVCAFNAIAVIKDHVLVFPELCHGCGGCSLLCPERAVVERPRKIGVVEAGVSCGIEFVHGKLNPGEAFAPPVTRAVKKRVRQDGIVIVDAPPGTSCPAVEAVRGSDFCLLVTEPTPFGLSDLELAVEMLEKLGIPAAVIINRSDIGDEKVDRYCEEKGIPVVGRIPFDRKVAEAYARGLTAVLTFPEWREVYASLGDRVLNLARAARPSRAPAGDERR